MSKLTSLARQLAESRGSALAALAALAAVGCRSAPGEPGEPGEPGAIGEVRPHDPPASAGPAVEFADLSFVPQPGWVVRAPASSFRLAEYALPRAEGDPADAELVVYHFGAGGGSILANVERWVGQFEAPEGGSARGSLVERELEIGGRAAHDVELSGTYVGETSPGSGEFRRDPGYRMRATIVPSAGGPCYIKLLGPERTVREWSASYAAFLDQLDG